MGAGGEGLAGKEQGLLPEIFGPDDFPLGKFIVTAQEQHPAVADRQGHLMVFGWVQPAVDKGEINQPPVQAGHGGSAVTADDVKAQAGILLPQLLGSFHEQGEVDGFTGADAYIAADFLTVQKFPSGLFYQGQDFLCPAPQELAVIGEQDAPGFTDKQLLAKFIFQFL